MLKTGENSSDMEQNNKTTVSEKQAKQASKTYWAKIVKIYEGKYPQCLKLCLEKKKENHPQMGK